MTVRVAESKTTSPVLPHATSSLRPNPGGDCISSTGIAVAQASEVGRDGDSGKECLRVAEVSSTTPPDASSKH